jgi:hypothetical protein
LHTCGSISEHDPEKHAGHADAAQRSCEALHFAGDAIMTDTEAFCAALGKASRA